MKINTLLGTIFILFIGVAHEDYATNLYENNPVSYIFNLVKQHPFITAAILVLALQKEPWDCIKGTVEYLFEEHPILSILVIGLIISGAYQELFDCAYFCTKVGQQMVRLISWVIEKSSCVHNYNLKLLF